MNKRLSNSIRFTLWALVAIPIVFIMLPITVLCIIVECLFEEILNWTWRK